MDLCDVLIVGGGPAGSTCASRLRAAGLDVLVWDRARFPRDKPCAGWLTLGVLETLGLQASDYAQGHTLQAFTGFITGRIGSREVKTEYGRPVSFGARRCELDHFLLERSGARFRGGAPVSRLVRQGGDWVVDDAVRTPLVVGAGGNFCPVARHLNGSFTGSSLVVAQEVEFRLDPRQSAACRVAPEAPELYFCRDLRGYGWCVRKGDYLNVGLGRRDARGLSGHVRSFVRFLEERGRVGGGIPSRWNGHAYFLYEGPPRRLVDDGLLLAGDAAGLAVSASGEGIRAAIESGLLAAEAVLAAGARRGREDLEPYAAALKARLGPRGPNGRPGAVVAGLGGALLSTRWFTRHLVLDRWFLQLRRTVLRANTFGEPRGQGVVEGNLGARA
jgi:flavin-dependent dehydrogenase